MHFKPVLLRDEGFSLLRDRERGEGRGGEEGREGGRESGRGDRALCVCVENVVCGGQALCVRREREIVCVRRERKLCFG